MGKRLTPPRAPAPITSPKIKHLAGIGLKTPSKLTNKQTQELAASVEAHIEPRGKGFKAAVEEVTRRRRRTPKTLI